MKHAIGPAAFALGFGLTLLYFERIIRRVGRQLHSAPRTARPPTSARRRARATV